MDGLIVIIRVSLALLLPWGARTHPLLETLILYSTLFSFCLLNELLRSCQEKVLEEPHYCLFDLDGMNLMARNLAPALHFTLIIFVSAPVINTFPFPSLFYSF